MALHCLMAVNATYRDDHGGRASPCLCNMNYVTTITVRIINKFLSLVYIQTRSQRGEEKDVCPLVRCVKFACKNSPTQAPMELTSLLIVRLSCPSLVLA